MQKIPFESLTWAPGFFWTTPLPQMMWLDLITVYFLHLHMGGCEVIFQNFQWLCFCFLPSINWSLYLRRVSHLGEVVRKRHFCPQCKQVFYKVCKKNMTKIIREDTHKKVVFLSGRTTKDLTLHKPFFFIFFFLNLIIA